MSEPARPHDADVKGKRALITRARDDRPPVGQHVSPTVKIAKRQGQERDIMGDSMVGEDRTAIMREIERVRRDLASQHHDEEDKPRLKAKLASLEKALGLSKVSDEARSKFNGAALDERRTAAGRAKLAEVQKSKLTEIASVMDYLVRRALADPHDHEARELAVRSMLTNHEPLGSNRITRLLGPVEHGIAHTAEAGGEAAVHALLSHGFKNVTPHGLLHTSLDDNALHKLAPKFAAIEHGWIQVADHRENHDQGAADLDTSSGFTGGPEMSEVTVFRTPDGHVARVIEAAIIGGDPYVLSATYLKREGF